MAATASSVIVFTTLPSVPQQEDRRADHDTAEAEDSRRDFDGVFQAEEPGDGTPCGREENIHSRTEQGLKYKYWSRRRLAGSTAVTARPVPR